jgi:hypothetical protein
MILNIPNNGEFKLEFENDNLTKFSMCRLSYQNNNFSVNICEDYVYIFIEDMLGGIATLPLLTDCNLFGRLGQWQEYYYYNAAYVENHTQKIDLTKKAVFFSSECYGAFIYQLNDKIWIEFNKGYDESSKMSPHEFYRNPSHYRILLVELPRATLYEWKKTLEKIRTCYLLD